MTTQHIRFIQQKAEEGCRLYEEDQPEEAEIALSEALQYSQGLIEEHPQDRSFQIFFAETHHIIALAYCHLEIFSKAREHLELAFNIYRQINGIGRDYEPILESSAARLEYKEGHDDKAVEILEKTLRNIEAKTYEEITEDSYIYCSNLLLAGMISFNCGRYPKAVEIVRRAITLKKTHPGCELNTHPKEYIELLNVAVFQSSEQKDGDFQRQVLEEGIEACRQAEKDGTPINPLSLGSFYQDQLRLLFFEEDEKAMKRTYDALMMHCDQHIEGEPELKKYKISGQLNYAVYCAKQGDLETAEMTVNEAISGCSEINDNDGPELTLFMVSALNILANIQWERGEHQGALSDLGSECKILSDYIESHSDLSPTLLPLRLELILNQCRLLHDAGRDAQCEALLESLKSEFKPIDEDLPDPDIAFSVMAMKKIADLHWSLDQYDQAKVEYHETLYLLKVLQDHLPEISDSIQELEDEINKILNDNNL